MDTLEMWSEYDSTGGQLQVGCKPPIVWRNKTPQEVAREHYPDHNFLKSRGGVPKSLRSDSDYCETYTCHPSDENNSGHKVYGTLIAIPDKK